jgi:hypothetical protein
VSNAAILKEGVPLATLFHDMNRRAKMKFNKHLKTKINDLSNLLEVSGLLTAPIKMWFNILCQKFKIKRKKN